MTKNLPRGARSAAELPSTACVIYVNDLAPLTFDDFVDPFEAGPAAAAAAGGAALAAAAAGGTAAAAPPVAAAAPPGRRLQPLHAEPRQPGIEN